jgi:hypothetical protein
MYKRTFVIIAVIIALAVRARAQQANAVNTKIQNGTISGTLSSQVAGPCSMTGYSAICPSVTNCSCITINSAKVSGSLAGNGIGVVRMTVDGGIATSAFLGSTCQPVFGVADLTTTIGRGANKTTKTETLNLQAALCDQLNNKRDGTLDGGFGIASAPAPSPIASGWGTIDGTMTDSKITLKLKGSITQ